MDQLIRPKAIPDCPALSGPAVVVRDSIRFRRGATEVTFQAPARLLAELAGLCDGRQTREEVLRGLGSRWRVDDVKGLLEALTEAGAVVEAGDQCAALWELVTNPQRFVEPATRAEASALAKAAQEKFDPRPHVEYKAPPEFALRGLLSQRRSSRTFSGAEVAEEAVLGLLWAAYGAAGTAGNGARGRTVPSGGALYPLEIFYCNLRPAGALQPGIYAVHYSADGRVGLARWMEDAQAIAAAIAEPDVLRSAQGAVLICGRFSSAARKYGNRALSLVTLEAGHAAQNALLAATALELAAVELGGFVEEHLVRACGLSSELTPLTLLSFGRPASAEQMQAATLAWAAAPEFQWANVGTAGMPSQYLGMTRFTGPSSKSTTVGWSWGRDPNPLLAHDKAVAEAWERQAYRQIGGVKILSAPFGELPAMVDPTIMVRYADWQYDQPGFRWQRFDPAVSRDWVKCEGLDGDAEAWVPVELVFQQESLSKAQRALALSRAESSGMAAYTTLEGAIERGLLELIERDAFMVNWIAQRATPAIAPGTLPGDVARRVAALDRAGFRVAFKDLSLETVPVVLAFGQAEALHQTVVATAAAYDAEAALNHALSELEASAATALAGGAVPAIEPAAVCTPADHLQLYKQRRYFRSADWIGSDAKTVPLTAIGSGRPRSYDELSRKLRALGYRALWRDMSLPGASLHQGSTRLHIARVLVPGLVPISFGFGTEALGLSRLANFCAAATPRGRKPRFPHPFA